MGRSFSVTDAYPHDLLIENGQIQIVSDGELFAQKLQAAWSTNKGEWSLNKNEGVDFHAVLTKNPDENLIRMELETMLSKISATARIASFETVKDRETRHMVITVTVQDGDAEITVPIEY